MIRLEMKNYNTILTEKQQISALPSGKIDEYKYLLGEEILPSNQRQIIEQTKFAYSPLGKAFEKQTKTTEEQGKKQVETLKSLTEEELESIEGLFPKIMKTGEIKNEIDQIK